MNHAFYVGGYHIQMIRLVVLGRILGPEAFGLLAMMLVVTGFVELLSQMGLSEAIIQHPDPTHIELSSLYRLLTSALW